MTCDDLKISNNNKISKVSDIFVLNQRIAKNIMKLRKEIWYSMHNKYCLKDYKLYTEISNIMFLIWIIKIVSFLNLYY